MDVVVEVRDARIPMATSHPQVMLYICFMKSKREEIVTKCVLSEQMDSWLGNRKKILVLNREDMISAADRNAWANFFSRQGIKVVFANGQLGMVSPNPKYSTNLW